MEGPLDDLKQYVRDRNQREPGFAALVDGALRRRAFMRQMADVRKAQGKSQTQVAAAMRTSPSIVSRLESGADVQLSTLEKYMAALGKRLTLGSIDVPARKSRRQSNGESRSRTATR